jgi:hypothetical protein
LPPPYKGPPYVLGKPGIIEALVRGFVAAGSKTYHSRDEINSALCQVANAQLKRLGIPVPDTPSELPQGAASAGGFSMGQDQELAPKGVWEIALLPPISVDSTPSKTPQAFAAHCGLVAHEYEHCVDAYLALRFALAKGDSEQYLIDKLSFPSRIIRLAREQPLKPNSPDFQQCEEMYWFFFFAHRLDQGKATGEVTDLQALAFSNSDEIKMLKRYNEHDADALELKYGKFLTSGFPGNGQPPRHRA